MNRAPKMAKSAGTVKAARSGAKVRTASRGPGDGEAAWATRPTGRVRDVREPWGIPCVARARSIGRPQLSGSTATGRASTRRRNPDNGGTRPDCATSGPRSCRATRGSSAPARMRPMRRECRRRSLALPSLARAGRRTRLHRRRARRDPRPPAACLPVDLPRLRARAPQIRAHHQAAHHDGEREDRRRGTSPVRLKPTERAQRTQQIDYGNSRQPSPNRPSASRLDPAGRTERGHRTRLDVS
jgi:hypothetical protein